MIISIKQRTALENAAKSIEIAITLRDALAERYCKRVHADMMQRLRVAHVSLGSNPLSAPSLAGYIQPIRRQLSQVQKRHEKGTVIMEKSA